MSGPGKDAFYQPSGAGEGIPEGRTTRDWTHRMFVDGVEVDPKTNQPLDSLEE